MIFGGDCDVRPNDFVFAIWSSVAGPQQLEDDRDVLGLLVPNRPVQAGDAATSLGQASMTSRMARPSCQKRVGLGSGGAKMFV